jgi:hypothetical protein
MGWKGRTISFRDGRAAARRSPVHAQIQARALAASSVNIADALAFIRSVSHDMLKASFTP